METLTPAYDHRIQNLSYSSLLTLHACPRLFQLSKLQAEKPEVDWEASVTFAFGHLVGSGLQGLLQNKSMDEVIWNEFLLWEPDLFADNPRQVKSFWHGLHALNKFEWMHSHGYLEDWELTYIGGEDGTLVPAVELSFRITFPDGFKYRGFVDAVLTHKVSGAVMVLEAKTTSSASLNPATYKNSAQAIGYSVVLDHLFPDLSSYEVLYLVYKTKSMEYEQLPFEKSYLQRALWIKELLLDIETIKLYESESIYPMHGESCYNYYRECEYLGICTLATPSLVDPEGEPKVETYQIELTLDDLIQSQLRKIEHKEN